jgi:hypothetical protein
MKINGYQLVYEPDALEKTNASLFSELQVPFGDHVIMDMGGTTSQYSFNLILKDDEIEDISGMINGYKLIYLEYGDIEGFFYVTQFDMNWVKNMDNYKIVSFKVSGYLANGDIYLKLAHFSDKQKTDYTTADNEYICIPEYYTSKPSEARDYEVTITTSGKHLSYYINQDLDVFFKASNNIFTEGLLKIWKNGKRLYGNSNVDGEIIVDTNLHTYTFPHNNATYTFTVKDYQANVVDTISDTLNYVNGDDTHISNSPFRTTLKANHTKYLFKPNKNYIEILKTPNDISHTAKVYNFVTKPNVTIGTRHLTTLDPATLMVDTSIAAGTPPTTISYINGPGWVKYTSGNTATFTFTTQINTHPLSGFYGNTERNYIGHCFPSQLSPIFINTGDWTSSGFTARTDGATYEGVTNYMSSETANATLTKTIAAQGLGPTGYFDIYMMASNYGTCPAGTYEFYVDAVLKGTTSQLNWTAADTKANFVYLGNHFLNTSSAHTFQLKLKTGKIGVFYLMLYPSTRSYPIEFKRTPYEEICSAFMDTNEAYEVY